MNYKLSCVLLLGLITSSVCLKVQDLGGDWILEDDTGKYKDLKATVPGGVYTDLQNNGVIGDIFFRYRDTEYKWVPRTNWTYSRNFTVDDKLLAHENIRIKCEGLDTVATVLINDVVVGEAENMFRQYIFDIKDTLKSGENTIEVRFFNPIQAGEIRNKEFTEGYIIPPECLPAEYNGECYVNQLRKMPASYSWDWGPSFPSVGIWKNVTIEAYNEAVIEYLVPDVVNGTDDKWTVNIDVYFSDNSNGRVQGHLVAVLEIDEYTTYVNEVDVDVKKDDHDELVQYLNLSVKKTDIELWWPNGYGNQKLYNLRVTFSDNKTENSTKSARLGFKTVELLQDKIDSGTLYYFKVNGEPIFMKGANEIPLHILPEKGQEFELVNRILSDVRDTNMNMLRIWGGGVYESDIFYDLCDEFGILLWHDYMFASSFYPVRQSFLDNAVLEARHQTKRLRGHACIAALAGNNENESNVRSWKDFLDKGDPEQYRKDYITLYIDNIKPEILRITHNRIIFIGSSPSSGVHSEEQNFIAEKPNEPPYGDMHMYIYNRDSFDSTIYPVPRFISEYGLQSYPCLDSIRTISNISEELEYGSDFLHQRDHHPDGDNQMRDLVKMQFNVPIEGSENYTRAIVYYSQVVDGWGMRISTEHYRRYRSYTNDQGLGYTMGTLLWQLNDVWVGPSWAGIDALGRWKVRQYYAKSFFAPVIITGLIDGDRKMNIYGISDLLYDTLGNLTATVEVYAWTSFEPVVAISEPVTLEPSASKLLKTRIEVDKYLAEYCGGGEDKAKNLCFFRLSLTNSTGHEVAPENFVFPTNIKYVWLETPDLQITSVTELGDNSFEISLKTDRIALFVWLESHDIRGRFSENAFTLYTETKNVTFKSDKPTTLEDFKNTLTVTNIRNDEFK